MPRSLKMKVSLASATGLAIGAAIMSLFGSATDRGIHPDRQIATVQTELSKPPLMMGKHLSVVQVALQSAGIPDSEDQETELIGWVRLNQPTDSDLKYRWELPEGVQALSGPTEGVLAGIQVGETKEIRLTVRGFSTEDLKLVALHGFIESGDTKLGNSAVLTSRPEDSIEMLDVAAGFQKRGLAGRPVLTGKIQR